VDTPTTGGTIPRRRTRYIKPAEFDPNPLYAEKPGAFDPRYGPDTQEQIDWHLRRGTPGAEGWEVGQPAKPYDKS
jgi:hypothetical protein